MNGVLHVSEPLFWPTMSHHPRRAGLRPPKVKTLTAAGSKNLNVKCSMLLKRSRAAGGGKRYIKGDNTSSATASSAAADETRSTATTTTTTGAKVFVPAVEQHLVARRLQQQQKAHTTNSFVCGNSSKSILSPPNSSSSRRDKVKHFVNLPAEFGTQQTLLRPGSVSQNFCATFQLQIPAKGIRSGVDLVIRKIDMEVQDIEKVIRGDMDNNFKRLTWEHSKPDEVVKDVNPVLLPKTKWVYETPDKQRMKRMDELQFEDDPIFEPAVIENSAKKKRVFQLHNNIDVPVDFSKFRNGDKVPVDMKYLRPVCSVDVNDSVEVNTFLTGKYEETIDIGEMTMPKLSLSSSRKRKHTDDDKENKFNWYELQMKRLATCRPSKSSSSSRRHMLLPKRSLSFQDLTPTSSTSSQLRLSQRFRSFDIPDVSINESVEGFMLQSEFNQGESMPEFMDCSFEKSNDLPAHVNMLFHDTKSNYDVSQSNFFSRNDYGDHN